MPRIFSASILNCLLNAMLVSPAQAIKGRLLLMVDWFKSPACVQRSAAEMKFLARETCGLALYYHQLCPASIRLRRALRELNVPIEMRDVRKSPVYCDDLLAGVGELRMPCLRVVQQGRVEWICEVEQILDYLQRHFGPYQGNRQIA